MHQPLCPGGPLGAAMTEAGSDGGGIRRMTTRERKERRLERRLDWAESRDRKSEAGFAAAHTVADGIPFGQPGVRRADIKRIDSGMRHGLDSANMADHHRAKAAGIEHQLRTSIYSDDEDAVERLEEKIARLEGERDRMKRINREIRKGDGWEARLKESGAPLTDGEKRALLDVARFQPYYCKDGRRPVFPPYALQNIGGNIGRLKKRLAQVRRDREAA